MMQKYQKWKTNILLILICRRECDETKCFFFLVKDFELLDEQNEIWGKGKNNLRKEFDSEPVYNEKYLKATKIMKK